MYEDDKPPLPPTSPPPDYLPEPIKNVTFSLSSEYDYNNLVPSSSPSPSSTSSPSSALYVSEYQYSSRLSPGIPLIPVVEHKPFSTAYFESFFHSEPSSWQYPPLTSTTSTTPPPMIVEEGIKNGSVVRPVTPRSIANSLDSLSECAQHHHSDVVNANTNSDRSRSLGDLLSATNQDGADSMRNGSYDTLVSKGGGGGLTDSGIGAGLLMMRDDMDMDDNALSSSPDRITTDISSPDSFSYPAVSFASYDPVGGANGNVSSYSNENTNPLDSSSRGHSTDDRKHTELPAISEESEHEQSIHIPYNHQPHSSSVGPSAQDLAREVVEHTYPMIHCNSAPSNASFLNNNIAHRRVVSEDGTEITRLKRSEEMENMDKIGRISFEKRSSSSHNLKKGRCKSAMLVFQSDPDDKEETDDEDDVDGYSKDNEMLILDKSGVDDKYRSAGGGGANNKKSSPLRHYDNHSNLPSISSNEPPPVLIQRKVSAVSTRSSPYKASDQSWKDKMPPFGMVGHTMYSPQSLPTRDAVPRSPFDGSSGTISGASGRLLISEEETSPDGRTSSETEYTTPLRPRLYDSIPSPPALLAATSEADLMMPLSEICNQHRFSISSSVNTESSPPKSQAGTPNSSFVRRSLRKIMKRNGSVSTSALNGGEERLGSLKRRASNVSSFFNSAQAHLRPRTKSLKKQSCTSMFMRGPSSGGEEYGDAYFPAASSTASLSSTSTSTSSSSPSPLSIGKKPKEKSGSDTFTFGNLFKRKPPTSRPNLADIISDLDQRSTTSRQMSSAGGSLSAGKNRRSTSATILPMNGGGPNEPDSSSLDGKRPFIHCVVSSRKTYKHRKEQNGKIFFILSHRGLYSLFLLLPHDVSSLIN
ncbi:hypothetical protein CAEBREN_20766 [Caenorhabditis brenneri]|uniref:Uncharacterized protein n=1 Tax=Caenorhabditis brenneri TaxID=135651 RepID=G0MJN1_CAEBE|nr:hypothetical protein CAEBREN_20766 [Caenorhabditis brenneri]